MRARLREAVAEEAAEQQQCSMARLREAVAEEAAWVVVGGLTVKSLFYSRTEPRTQVGRSLR